MSTGSKVLLVPGLLAFALSARAAELDSACQYWSKRADQLNSEIVAVKTELSSCSGDVCHRLDVLVGSLELERSGTHARLAEYCEAE